MRRFAIYAGAVIVLLSLVTTILAITTHRTASPLCPDCHAPDAHVGVSYDHATIYVCRSCKTNFYGPARKDFSWIAAAEDLFSTEHDNSP